MTFKKKIISIISLSLLICVPLAFIAVMRVHEANESFTYVAKIRERMDLFGQIAQYLADFERGQKGYMLVGDAEYLEPYSIAEAKFNGVVEKAIGITEDEEAKKKLQELIKIKNEWIQNSSIPQMMAKKKHDRSMITTETYIQTLKSFNDKATFRKIHDVLDLLKKKELENYSRLVSKADRLADGSTYLSLASVAAFVTSMILIGLLAVRSTVQVNSLIVDLVQMSNMSTGKIQELEKVSQDLTHVTREQASAIQTTSSATTELSATVDSNSNSISQSMSVTIEGEKVAQEGEKVGISLNSKLIEMKDSLHSELKAISSGFSEVEKFSERVAEIRGMTKLINDIVFQTKLLSFNASVEAARAGEAGRGFSVVAEEVGRLSQMSGDSAKQIEDTLNSASDEIVKITAANKDIISAIEKRIDSTMDQVIAYGRDNGKAFSTILEVSQKIRAAFEHVNQSSGEQLQGIKDIENNMNNLSTVGSNTSRAAETTMRIVQDLQKSMDKVEGAVDQLTAEFIGKAKGQSDAEDEKRGPKVKEANDLSKAA